MKIWCLAPFAFLPYIKDVYYLVRESLSLHADELYRSDPHEEHEAFGVHVDGKGVLDYSWDEEAMRWGYLNFNRKVWESVASKFDVAKDPTQEAHEEHIMMFEPGHDGWKELCKFMRIKRKQCPDRLGHPFPHLMHRETYLSGREWLFLPSFSCIASFFFVPVIEW